VNGFVAGVTGQLAGANGLPPTWGVVFVNSVTPGFLLTTIAQAFVDNL